MFYAGECNDQLSTAGAAAYGRGRAMEGDSLAWAHHQDAAGLSSGSDSRIWNVDSIGLWIGGKRSKMSQG